jgi:hypothetical protein
MGLITKGLAVGVLTGAACISAGGPSIATASSIQDIILDGHTLAAAGVTSWPLVVGDTLQSTASQATLLFRDGSSVTLSPESKLRILGTQAKPRIVLVAGTLDYRLSPGSEVTLSSDEGSAPPDPSPQQTVDSNPPPEDTSNGKASSHHSHRTPTVVHSQSYYFFQGVLVAGVAVGGTDAIYHTLSNSKNQSSLSPGAVSH